MNTKPIETALDADLRLSHRALVRAAQRAREIAAQTGTLLVISRHGVIDQISPKIEPASSRVHEPVTPYGAKP